MFEGRDDAVSEVLKSRRRLSAARIEELRQRAVAAKVSLADLAIEDGDCSSAALLEAAALFLGCTYVSKLPTALVPEVTSTIPAELARERRVVPWRIEGGKLVVLTADIFDEHLAADLSFALGREVSLGVCDRSELDRLIQQHYSDQPAFGAGTNSAADEGNVSVDALADMAEQPPVIRFVNRVLAQGIRDQASDIHLEPFAHEFKIRYRVDGVLHEMAPPPRALALPITSRIKVLADLDIAERRLPQDGRIRLRLKERAVDLRVSTLPTQGGESVVLRVLDQSTRQFELSKLGIPEDVRRGVHSVINRPNGIFIVTGPTGSGKTTTLYSALREINTVDLKLLTAEDPVEYVVEGITQVAINPAAGLTFASALRAFLRQDPDVIMIGEMRDLETAQTAIQASLTGHLVMSTLHTNNATGAVTRLLDMGIEPFLVAATLEGVLAQRLLRRICPGCRTAIAPSTDEFANAGVTREEIPGHRLFVGSGCAECANTGYRGRVGIYEWLPMTDALRELISSNLPAPELQRRARASGMRTLREEGLRAAFAGETTLGEVLLHT